LELIGLYLIACALLVVAGLAKLVRPDDTARALAALVPVPLAGLRGLVRVGAAAEAALGLGALAAPRTVSASLVAVSYAAFAVFIAYARAKGGAIASCGCFGTPDTPATALHAVVNLGLAAAAVAVAVAAPTGSIISILAAQPLHGVPLVVVSALGAWLAYLAVSVLAALQAARKLTGVTFATRVTGG
jgi:hypothetical protein